MWNMRPKHFYDLIYIMFRGPFWKFNDDILISLELPFKTWKFKIHTLPSQDHSSGSTIFSTVLSIWKTQHTTDGTAYPNKHPKIVLCQLGRHASTPYRELNNSACRKTDRLLSFVTGNRSFWSFKKGLSITKKISGRHHNCLSPA